MKVYRLLRNNKEMGPYSAEELKSLNLKAYDLIWVDGKSASWRYPGEIDELQSFAPPVEEQPFDRFYKQKTDAKKTSSETIKKTSSEPVPVKAAIEPAEVKKEKPRIRVKAEWSVAKEEEPVNVVTRPEPQVQPKEKVHNIFSHTTPVVAKEQSKENFGWQEAFDDWKKETPVIAKKTAAPAAVKQEIKRKDNYVYEPEMLEEDPAKVALSSYYDKRVKMDNASKPHVSKNSFRHYVNYITPIIFILIIGGFAVYMNKDDKDVAAKNNGEPQSQTTAANVKDETPADKDQPGLTDLSNDDANSQLSNNNATSSTQVKTNEANNKIEADAAKPSMQKNIPPVVADKNTTIKKQEQPKVAGNSTAVNKTQPVNKQPVNNQPVVNKPSSSSDNSLAKNNNTANNSSATTTDNNASTEEPETKPAPEKKAPATIGNYVQMQTVTQTEGNKRLQVRNISDTKLDLVVVDIQYYDANNKFAKGESIYLHNIPAGKNMLVNTPDDKMASRITAKVSLVSSDEKNIYLVGE